MTHKIVLTAEEVRVCTLVAVERWLTKRGSVDRPNYAAGKEAGKLEHELLASIRANVSEYAVSKLYELPWTFPWYPNDQHPLRKNHPDVGVNLEVRTIRTQLGIPVWKKDYDKRAVIVGTRVLDPDFFAEVEVLGWFPAVDVRRPEWVSLKENCYRVPVTELHQTIFGGTA